MCEIALSSTFTLAILNLFLECVGISKPWTLPLLPYFRPPHSIGSLMGYQFIDLSAEHNLSFGKSGHLFQLVTKRNESDVEADEIGITSKSCGWYLYISMPRFWIYLSTWKLTMDENKHVNMLVLGTWDAHICNEATGSIALDFCLHQASYKHKSSLIIL